MIKNHKPLLLVKFIFILIGLFYSVNFYNLNAVGTTYKCYYKPKRRARNKNNSFF
ncbi:MAG: hypothetical protein Q8830_01820 [Candidatus Phytoplasma australasiaticum]|nr:hypothetical protein [Candidatus Phytoplasma australasiaticum]